MEPPHKQSVVREASCAAVWGPWLAAPLFALLPIAGCGLAGGIHSAAAHPPGATAAAPVAPAVPVVPVVMADNRPVAWKSAAN